MAVELILFHLFLMVIVGPGITIYGVVIIARQRVRIFGDKMLKGGSAVFAGIITLFSGVAFAYFLWCMLGFFPH